MAAEGMLANLNRGAERKCFRVADLFEQIDNRHTALRGLTCARGAHGEKGEEAAALNLAAERAREWT